MFFSDIFNSVREIVLDTFEGFYFTLLGTKIFSASHHLTSENNIPKFSVHDKHSPKSLLRDLSEGETLAL